MLIIFNKDIINLDVMSQISIRENEIKFYITYETASYLGFENEKKAKKAFDRIIYAYANEYRTLDLSEYGE